MTLSRVTASKPFPASGLLENSKGCFCEIALFPNPYLKLPYLTAALPRLSRLRGTLSLAHLSRSSLSDIEQNLETNWSLSSRIVCCALPEIRNLYSSSHRSRCSPVPLLDEKRPFKMRIASVKYSKKSALSLLSASNSGPRDLI